MNRHELMEFYGLDERDLDDGRDDNARCVDCGRECEQRSTLATRTQPAELIGPESCLGCGGELEAL